MFLVSVPVGRHVFSHFAENRIVEAVTMSAVVFVLHVLIVTVHLRGHVHHLELYLSPLTHTHRQCVCLCYLLGQDGDGLLVFGVSQVDAVDGEDGVPHMQTPTSVCRLGGMDLRDENRNTVLLPPLRRRQNQS
ncbi:hypothetical protein F7725_019181 [Dissostichus mawsoni]|uniref:Uncharacterized protein n=1 Tax=Dissostichus mawsoni TaxID=36200 RepID=A0A7J5YJ08_DISMA|nr:hypothetical protein F7725_019181 [Dissostichus mawsoni]